MTRHGRVVLIQRVCPHYRVPFFRCLAEACDLLLLYGRGDRSGSFRSVERPSGFESKRLARLHLDLTFIHPYLRIVCFPLLALHLVRAAPARIICGGVSDFLNSLVALVYARLARVPLIIWDSGRSVDKPMSWVRRVAEPVSRLLLRSADACVAYGRVAAVSFEAAGVSRSRIFLAPNTIDVERVAAEREALLHAGARSRTRAELGIPLDAPVLLYVGAVEPRKRLETLVDYVEQERAAGVGVVLVVVGDGVDLERLKGQVAVRGLAERVRFLGRVVEDVGRLFVTADVFVLPGPGGLSVNQAMAYGLPVVVWGGDGTERDLVEDGTTGYLVADREAMFRRLDDLVTAPAARGRMAAGARAAIGGFTLGRMRRGFLDALDRCLPGEGPSEESPGGPPRAMFERGRTDVASR